jgi:hypothetical protein
VKIIAEPREELEVLQPASPDADMHQLTEDVREWESSCVNHLCGCNCSC